MSQRTAAESIVPQLQWRSQKFGLGVQLDKFGLEALLSKYCE